MGVGWLIDGREEVRARGGSRARKNPTLVTMKSNPAIPCPECSTMIPLDPATLFSGGTFTCAECKTQVTLAQDTERKLRKAKR